jgi:serine/threonine protein kinase
MAMLVVTENNTHPPVPVLATEMAAPCPGGKSNGVLYDDDDDNDDDNNHNNNAINHKSYDKGDDDRSANRAAAVEEETGPRPPSDVALDAPPIVVRTHKEHGEAAHMVVPGVDTAAPDSSPPIPAAAPATGTDMLPDQAPPQRTAPTGRAPTVVHGYTLLETLGTGTFGRVRRAEKGGASFAIKIVSRQQLADTAMTPQLKREVAIQKSLHHPNIVQLRQVLRSPNKLYMVLELASEGELYWAVQQNGPLTLLAARRALFQLTDAVVFCHHRGICHRDIKPENILLDRDHNIKLTDFGLSSSSDPAHAHAYGGVENLPDPRLLRTACGSPHYCAPEVRSPGKCGTYDGRKADAWSVGIVLFLMVNGFLPFHDDDPQVLQSLVESQPVVYPLTMPDQPRRICERLLERDPLRRWSLEKVLDHPWCKADLSLKRAVDSSPLFSAAPSCAQPLSASGAWLSGKGAQGWQNVDHVPIPDAPVPRGIVPREVVPERADTESFSERDDLSGPRLVPLTKPRRKSMMSMRTLGRLRLPSGREDDKSSACLSDDGHDASMRFLPKVSKTRRRFGSLGMQARESMSRRHSQSGPSPPDVSASGRLHVRLNLPRVFGGFGANRKAAVPV